MSWSLTRVSPVRRSLTIDSTESKQCKVTNKKATILEGTRKTQH